MNIFKTAPKTVSKVDKDYQQFLLTIAKQFIDVSPSNIETLITQCLEELVQFTETDRGFIYLYSNYGSEMVMKNYYYKQGIKPKIEHHQKINSEDFKEIISTINNKSSFTLNSKRDLSPKAYTIKSILDVEETKSFIACPLIENDTVVGFIGLDTVHEEMQWNGKHLELIRIFGEFISSVLKRKKTVERGLNMEQKLRALFEKIEDTVFVSTPEGKILEINPAGLKLLGYSSYEEIMQVNIPEGLYTNKKDWETFKNIIEKQGFVKDYESTLKCKDGRKIDVIETSTIIKNEEGKITAYEGIIRDVTNRKRLEQQLFQSHKMESIGMLAGGIAHDFNNILTVILGLSDILLLKMDENSPFYKGVSEIRNSGKKAENLIKQLLGFSRKQLMTPKVINLNDVVTELYKMITRLITEDIKVQIIPAERLRYMLADPTQIQQILVNLVVNAGHAIKDDESKGKEKKITIRTDNVFLDKEFAVKNPGSKSGKYIMLSVKDSGIGMDEKTKEQIFEPFFTTKGEVRGTGLGLATVYGIVKQNKGFILVESEPGKGTEFQIYWPVTESEASDKTKNAESEIRFTNETNRTIMVVEDDPAVMELAKTVLIKIGYKVLFAENGKEALKLINTQNLAYKIDLLFSDIVMPEMNGEELALKVLELNPEIKILLSSGYTRSNVFEVNSSRDNYTFLLKPYTIKQLEKTIRLIFEKSN